MTPAERYIALQTQEKATMNAEETMKHEILGTGIVSGTMGSARWAPGILGDQGTIGSAGGSMEYKAPEPDLTVDSGDRFLHVLDTIAKEDADGLKKAQASYGNSWKSRGGVGAFMMLARKWDRLENRLKKDPAYDIFGHIVADQRAEGVIDDIRDLRRYLMLVEAELRARGFDANHRDNK